jgi:hypothetical protein
MTFQQIAGHLRGPFNERVAKTEDCWLWTGQTYETKRPYGRFHFRDKRYLAHRISWVLHFGEIPPGLLVCHRCDNPKCVRPDHLFLGTYADNKWDSVRKGRARKSHMQATGCCVHGHEMTEENTRYRLSTDRHNGLPRTTVRQCRKCDRSYKGRNVRARTKEIA